MLLEGFEGEAVRERVEHYLLVHVEESELVSGLVDLEDLPIWGVGVVQARVTAWVVIDYLLCLFGCHSYGVNWIMLSYMAFSVGIPLWLSLSRQSFISRE